MSGLDLRTVLLGHVLTTALGALVIGSLWRRHRGHSRGLGLWLANYVLQAAAAGMIALRGTLVDWLSILGGVPLILVGAFLLYLGLERYVGKPGPQVHNYLGLGLLIGVHTYFTLVHPNLAIRTLNLTLGLLVICAQSAWLLLRRVDPELRSATRWAGRVFVAYCLVSVTRGIIDAAAPPGEDFFQPRWHDTLVILSYQTLAIALTFALLLMVSGRLSAELELDIAERQRAEAALHDAQGELERRIAERTAALQQSMAEVVDLYDRSPCGYHSLDAEGTVVRINDTELKWLGYERDEVLGRMKFIDFLTPASRLTFQETFPRFKERGWVRDLEFEMVRKDGTLLVVLLNATAIRDAEGRFHISRSTMVDITERKRAEAALRHAHDELELRVQERTAELVGAIHALRAAQDRTSQLLTEAQQSRRAILSVLEDQKAAETEVRHLNEELERRVAARTAQLEQANQELEAFSYSVSHDLRTPLRHILGYVDLLRRRAQPCLDETARRYLKNTVDSAAAMERLIEDLLAFSRVGRYEMRHTKIRMNEFVREAAAVAEREASGREITWRIGALPEVRADPELLRLVLANLLANAVKYTRPRNPAIIEIGGSANQDETVFYVRDNGVGFDMRYVDRLFGVFQRLHGSTEFEGTGIGLANVRRIIHRHGGRTWAEGAVDRGATFFFSLPSSIASYA